MAYKIGYTMKICGLLSDVYVYTSTKVSNIKYKCEMDCETEERCYYSHVLVCLCVCRCVCACVDE